MAKKNESLVDKAFRYGEALLSGGALSVGKEAIDDYKAYKEERSWEDNMLSRIDDAMEKEDYKEALKISNLILAEDDIDEDVLREAKWYKAQSCSRLGTNLWDWDYSPRDEKNKEARELLAQAKDLLYDYGNEYGWNDDIVFELLWIYDTWDYSILARNFAIILMGSENQSYKSLAAKVYDRITDVIMHSFSKHIDNAWYYDLDEEERKDKELVEIAREDAVYSKFTNNFPYESRKYVYVGRNTQQIAGTYQLYDKERIVNWIFTLDQLPPDIVFPSLSRPQPGLYMAHPVKTEQYYPMKGVEETLFMEKVREFCWFVQCLGATRVSFHSNKGLSVSQGMGSTMNVEAQVGIKSVNVGGGYGNTMKRDDAYTSNQQVELVQNFAPKKRAYCPDDLIWLDSDPAWQMLLKQRLEGGIMEYTYKISSSETCQMSTNEMESVKANFEYMMVKVNGSYDVSTDKTFCSNEETEWSIHVEFAPLEELTEEPNRTKSDNNQNKTTMKDYEKMDGGMSLTEQENKEYISRMKSPFSMEIKDVWELENYPQKPMALGRVWSGFIDIEKDDKVVIVSDGKKIEATVFGVGMFGKILEYAEAGDACGIILQDVDADNVQTGAVIYKQSEYSENDGTTELTDAEQEYLDMVKECLEDGEIGARERKLLDKIRVKNGISEKRAQELKASLSAPQLTDDEKEYLEAFKDACEDGKVSDKQRKLLEKLRVMFGISEERAKEIEKL